jgi:hypothetical protein
MVYVLHQRPSRKVKKAMYIQPNLVERESNKYYTSRVCICSPTYLGCSVFVPYCHLWSAPLYSIFPHLSHEGTIFEKEITKHKMCV